VTAAGGGHGHAFPGNALMGTRGLTKGSKAWKQGFLPDVAWLAASKRNVILKPAHLISGP
jgi:hypothetical protein